MTSKSRPPIVLLNSDEIDELLEPQEVHRVRQDSQADDKKAQMAVLNEKFSRVARTLDAHWGTQEFYPYMNSLLFTDRNDRDGFPAHVVAALANLLRIHSRLHPRTGSSLSGENVKPG